MTRAKRSRAESPAPSTPPCASMPANWRLRTIEAIIDNRFAFLLLSSCIPPPGTTVACPNAVQRVPLCSQVLQAGADGGGRAGKRHRPVRGRDCAQSRVPRPGQVSAQIGRPVRAHLPAMVNACNLYDSAASPKGELGKYEELSARTCKEARRWRPVRQTTRDRTSRAEESWNFRNPGIPGIRKYW